MFGTFGTNISATVMEDTQDYDILDISGETSTGLKAVEMVWSIRFSMLDEGQRQITRIRLAKDYDAVKSRYGNVHTNIRLCSNTRHTSLYVTYPPLAARIVVYS